jgi:hypothetical protein
MLRGQLWSYDELHGVVALTRLRILCPGATTPVTLYEPGNRAGSRHAEHTQAVDGVSKQEARAVQAEACDA